MIDLKDDCVQITHKGEMMWIKEDEKGDLSILSDKNLIIAPVSNNKAKIFLGYMKNIIKRKKTEC